MNDLPEIEWILFTIFDHPDDAPKEIVVRGTLIRGQADPGNPVPLPWRLTFKTIAAARAEIHRIKPGAVCLSRDPLDAAPIVESWF